MTIPKTWRDRTHKYHLVQEFKDGEVELVVYKCWWKYKQRWNYTVEKKYLIENMLRWLKEVDFDYEDGNRLYEEQPDAFGSFHGC